MSSKYYGQGNLFLLAPSREELLWEKAQYERDPDTFTVFDPMIVDTEEGPQYIMQIVLNKGKEILS